MTALSSAFLTFTLTFAVCSTAQVNDQAIRQNVLKKAIVDSSFIYGKWTENGGTETHLKYLGQVRTKHGQTFKILNSTLFWGLSQRATSRILVFNNKNKYIGSYYVSMTTDLPTKMVNGRLVFINTANACDETLTTIVNMKNGLPKQFFRKCSGEYGDNLSFDAQ
jgi:hypothetical protein